MYVCCCNAVTDREVAEAIDAGARSRAEVTRSCGAGGDCGACHATIEGMIEAKVCGAKTEQVVSPVAPVSPLLPAAALVRERAA